MKKILIIIFIFSSSIVFAGEGDKYICKVTNVNKSTPSGLIDSGIDINTLFKIEWKKGTLVLDGKETFEIIATENETLIAKQDIQVNFEPYKIPFATIYLSDGKFSLSQHSPNDSFSTLSIFANCGN